MFSEMRGPERTRDLTIHATLPDGADAKNRITGLVSGNPAETKVRNGKLNIPVHVEMSDALLAYLIEW